MLIVSNSLDAKNVKNSNSSALIEFEITYSGLQITRIGSQILGESNFKLKPLFVVWPDGKST